MLFDDAEADLRRSKVSRRPSDGSYALAKVALSSKFIQEPFLEYLSYRFEGYINYSIELPISRILFKVDFTSHLTIVQVVIACSL